MERDSLQNKIKSLKKHIGSEFHLYQIDDLCIKLFNCKSIFQSDLLIESIIQQKELIYKVLNGQKESINAFLQFDLIEDNLEVEYPIIKLVDIGIQKQSTMLEENASRYMYN